MHFGVKGAAFAVVSVIAASLSAKAPVDWVNTEIGTISHMLVPCFQTVQRPNAMLRFLPPHYDYTQDRVGPLRLQVPGHRDPGVFLFAPKSGAEVPLTWDQVHSSPYRYDVLFDSIATRFAIAPARYSALLSLSFEREEVHAVEISPVNSRAGSIEVKGRFVSGRDPFRSEIKGASGTAAVYLYGEFNREPLAVEKRGAVHRIVFPSERGELKFRYAVSYIGIDQAKANLEKEIAHWDIEKIAVEGRDEWNHALGQIEIEGGTDAEKAVFYSSLWRCFERMVNVTEDGRYYGWDGKAHDSEGIPYYTDDWIWDTFRAAHPLMTLLRPSAESAKLTSYIRAARQNHEHWMPVFPTIAGDRHCMINRHAAIMFADAWEKGVRNFDLAAAFELMDRTEEEESLVPWYRGPLTELDRFYKEHGYYPALRADEKETCPAVDTNWERRQTVSVTQGASYDAWALAKIARILGRNDRAEVYARRASGYRLLWNPETKFFHPKDSSGAFIKPFDYMRCGGFGARNYYTENNAWTYIWDVQHDLSGLLELFGGEKNMEARLDEMFNTSVGCRFNFVKDMPDGCTGLMGAFTMANEPAFHIPYLYNYAGAPWKTQKLVRKLLEAWFRNDKMGMCGDEDGGGMSAFAVFSMLGFYPVTPGIAEYQWGSPVFRKVVIHLENGRDFVLSAPSATRDAKYINSVRINGKVSDSTRIRHEDVASGGEIVVEMASRANHSWGRGR